MNHHVAPPASDLRRKSHYQIETVTCRCGKEFTYRKSPGHPRILCADCTIERRADEATRINRAARDRAMALPKVWTTVQRRSYVSAQGHLDKALNQFSDLTGAQQRELIERFMVAVSGQKPSRSLPPRAP